MVSRSPEIIVALDLPDVAEVQRVVEQLPESIRWYKVGLELFTAVGPAVLEPLRARGKHIFLDLKLHDIPNTVAGAIRSILPHQVDLLTVHALGGRAMLAAAAEAARQGSGVVPRLVAVTTLTSLDQNDLTTLGITRTVPDQALALSRLALGCGIDGVVCSAQEAGKLRSALGPQPLLVTPGIRLPGEATGDQRRVATPSQAVRDGADFLVVGRSLLNAPAPVAMAEQLLAQLNPADG